MSGADASFTITRTKADYFWAIAFTSLQSPIIPLFFAAALFIVPVLSAIADGGFSREQLVVSAAVFALLLVLYYASLFVAVWFVARKNWRTPGALEPLAYSFMPAGIETSYAFGHGQAAWALWKSALETQDLILIRHTLGPVHIIPKRSLDSALLIRLRAILRERLGAKAKLMREGTT